MFNFIPLFFDQLNNQLITFIHIDCDLYSSTSLILQSLLENYYIKHFLSSSSSPLDNNNNDINCIILLFNELIDYNGYENHEIKALYEFYYQLYHLIREQNNKFILLEMLPRQFITIHQVVAFRLCIFS